MFVDDVLVVDHGDTCFQGTGVLQGLAGVAEAAK